MTLLTPSSKTSFRVNRPLDHWRKASCEEIACPHWREGWELVMGLNPECLHVNEAACDKLKCHWPEVQWIRAGGSKRRFMEREQIEPMIYQFHFPAEQPCFKESRHKVPRGIDPLLLKQIGSRIIALDWDEWSYRFNEEMYEADRRMKAG